MTIFSSNMRGLLPDRFVERVKATAKIVDVVSDFAELRRRGSKDWQCLCPLHNDEHLGNVSISEKRNVFSCFSCGKTLSPVSFVMEVKNCSFREAVLYLANKYNIQDMDVTEYHNVPNVNKKETARQKAIYHFGYNEIPINSNAFNPLFQYLKDVFREGEMWNKFQMVISQYRVITSGSGGTYGWTVFPNIDAYGNYLTAKYMEYDRNGRRVKADNDGKKIYSITYLHTLREKAGLLTLGGSVIKFCLFGLHLLNRYPTAAICVCESEKTAIIAQTFYDFNDNLFMATGGKNRLTLQFLQPLIDNKRKVILYPDVDAFDDWENKATHIKEELRQKSISADIGVTQIIMDLYDPNQDSPKSDIADILLRIYKNKMSDPALLPVDRITEQSHRE